MRTAGLVLCGILITAGAQVESARLVGSFETPAEVQAIQTAGASVRRVSAHATDGRYALEARFDPGEEPRIDIPVSAGDWQSTRPHDRAGRWDIARRHALDRLSAKLSLAGEGTVAAVPPPDAGDAARRTPRRPPAVDRKSTRLNSSHLGI